jgi:hypothetical protein
MAARFHLPKKKCVKRLVSKARRGTIVGTLKRGSTFFLIACPKGQMGRNRRCKVGTRSVEMIKPASRGKCPVGYKRG